MDPAAERDLVARLRRGDGEAFDSIYAGFRGPIFGFLARLSGRRDVAEDLLQETFVRLAANAPALAEDTRLAAWLYTVARRLLYSHARASRTDVARIERATLDEPVAVPTPFDEAAAHEAGFELERALARLPTAAREALLLVAGDDLQPGEAARVLGISPEALRQRLSRARALLREALAEPSIARRAAGGIQR